jgi:hypothetical protein
MTEAAAVRVLKFATIPEMRPKRGDPATEKVDAKGFLLDDKGNRRMELQHVDWCYYASPTAAAAMVNIERVDHLMPDPAFVRNSPESMKAKFMQARWATIKSHYEAWKQGQEVPTNGISLAAWPGLTVEQAEVLRGRGIRTVEEVRDLSSNQCDNIPLPNVRELKKQAGLFIENKAAAVSAERDRQNQEIISSLQVQISQMREEMARMQPSEDKADQDEVALLREQLDALGVEYDKRWAAPKLRSALQSAATSQAA